MRDSKNAANQPSSESSAKTTESAELSAEQELIAAPQPKLLASQNAIMRQRALLQLSRTHGNQYVLRLIDNMEQRRQAGVPAIQKQDEGEGGGENSAEGGATGAAAQKEPVRLSGEEEELLRQIREINDDWWVHEFAEWDLERLWDYIGPTRLKVILEDDVIWKDWTTSYEAGAELYNINSTSDYRNSFESDVKDIAKGYMDENMKIVHAELAKIGATPEQAGQLSTENEEHLKTMQKVAQDVVVLQTSISDLSAIPVGYNQIMVPQLGFKDVAAYFDPANRPLKPPKGDEEQSWATWDEINENAYAPAASALSAFGAEYPSIFAMISEGNIDEFATSTDFEEAQLKMAQALMTVYEAISATKPKLDTGDLPWQSLKPIHDQMYRGQAKGDSNLDWQGKLPLWMAKAVIGDFEDTEFWTSLGLGTLAAAAFIFASFATGGLAAFLTGAGIGLGIGQAGMSWEKYEDLATAGQTNISENSALVTDGQVNEALLTAILDTVFVMLDLYAPAADALKLLRGPNLVKEAVEAGLKRGAIEGLEAIGEMTVEEAAPLVTQSIVQSGIEETLRRTGKSVDELLEIVGEGSEAGLRLNSFKELAEQGLRSGEEIAAQLPKLGELAGEVAEATMRQAIEQFGPMKALKMAGGWKAVSSVLGDGSEAGQMLVAYRKQIFDDLLAFAADLPADGGKVLQETGTDPFKNFTSDLDISFLGSHSAENREKALSFLVGRMDNASIDDVGKLLYTDLFTDPRRLHLVDQITDPILRNTLAEKTAMFEQQVIFGHRLHQAMEAGDEGMVGMIQSQIRDLGIPDVVPLKPLDKGAISDLYKQVDEMHQEFNRLIAEGNEELAAKQAEEIAKTQSIINANEGGGYFSGGGTRKVVSERDEFPGFEAGNPNRAPMLAPQDYTALLDQLPKLDEVSMELQKLLSATDPDPGKIFKTLKAIGKYGERATEMLPTFLRKELTETMPAMRFNEFADEFSDLIASARVGGNLGDQIAADATALMQKVAQDLNQFEGWQYEVIQILNREANLEPVEAGFKAVQALMQRNAKFKSFISPINNQARAAQQFIEEAIRQGTPDPSE